MRRGRWLYHPDQYTEQNPVFQVKKAAVRLSAYTAGQQVPLEVLVGDNPGDPGAYWAPWQLNDQTIILEDGQSTQAIVVNAGWYRVDTTAITGTDAMVWVEDQENTMDDWAMPVQILRPGCAGGTTPPPPQPVDPIPVNCEQLHVLLNTASLVAGRWYEITNATPLLDAGQRVYVPAVTADRVGESALFYAPNLTQETLWPAKINIDGPCQLIELHDTGKNNLVRGYTTIQQWNWQAFVYDNVVEDSYVLIDFKSQMRGNEIRNSRVYAQAARVENNVFDQAYVWTAIGDTASSIIDCTVQSGGRLYATPTNNLIVGIHVSNTVVSENGYLYVQGPSTAGVPIFVSDTKVGTTGYFAISGDHYSVSAFGGLRIGGCEVDTGGYFFLREAIGSGFSARYANVRVLSRSYVNVYGVGTMYSVTVKERGWLMHRYMNVVTPGLSWGEATLQSVEVSGGASVNLQWHGNDVPAEPPYMINCKFRTGAMLSTSYVGRYNFQLLEMSDGASFQYAPPASTSTGVFLWRVKMKTACRIQFLASAPDAPTSLSITRTEYRTGHYQFLYDAAVIIDQCRFGSGRSYIANLVAYNRLHNIEATSGTSLAIQNTARLNVQDCAFHYGDVSIDGANLATGIQCTGLVVDSSQFSMAATSIPTYYGIYGVTVSAGSSIRVTHSGGQGASSSLVNSIFGGGVSGNINYVQANNTFVSLTGLYAFGETVPFTYNATATFTGPMTRNF